MPIVAGLGFGDEGKGITTSYLCSLMSNPLVVRFNGGHQAGHTVVYNNKRHVFSSFGSGTLQDVPTYWSEYCTFYPTAVINEFNVLNKIGISPSLFVNSLCPVVTPYDIQVNQLQEKNQRHGSVGVGFGTTLKRHEDNHYKLFVQDLFYKDVVLAKLQNISSYYYKYSLDKEDMEEYLENIEKVTRIIKLASNDILHQYDPIFEGAQGVLLDQDFGFFPNVTRSNTTTKNALSLYPSEKTQVYYVIRSYQTRHGNGFMTNEDDNLQLINNENETNQQHEYQGKFRKGTLDVNLLNYALDCDNNYSSKLIKNLVITCLDQYNIDVDGLLSKLKYSFDKVYISKGPSLKDISLYKLKNKPLPTVYYPHYEPSNV